MVCKRSIMNISSGFSFFFEGTRGLSSTVVVVVERGGKRKVGRRGREGTRRSEESGWGLRDKRKREEVLFFSVCFFRQKTTRTQTVQVHSRP